VEAWLLGIACGRFKMTEIKSLWRCTFNTLNANLNPICHLLALLEAHHILHVSSIRVKGQVAIILTSY